MTALGAGRRWRWAMVLIAGMGLLSACGETGSQNTPDPEEIPEQITYGYHTTETRSAVLQWELWGRSAQRFSDRDQLFLQDVRMVFYRDGVKDATLTSRSGEVDEKSRNMTASGEVVVVSESGRTLESEVLHWDNKRELIHTDQFVRVTEGDQLLTGYGLETDPDMRNLVLREQVEGDLPAESTAPQETKSP